jgi:hypothetical protein
MVVGLLLEPQWFQLVVESAAQSADGQSLIASWCQPEPKQMKMVRHQAIHRANQLSLGSHMAKMNSEDFVEAGRQPACGAVLHRHGPVDESVALVAILRQAGKVHNEGLVTIPRAGIKLQR